MGAETQTMLRKSESQPRSIAWRKAVSIEVDLKRFAVMYGRGTRQHAVRTDRLDRLTRRRQHRTLCGAVVSLAWIQPAFAGLVTCKRCIKALERESK